jgi:transposase
MRAITSDKRSAALSLLQKEFSTRKITAAIGISHQTINNIRRKEMPDLIPPKAGRPSRLTEREKRALVRQITSGKADTAVELAHHLFQITEKCVATETIRSALKAQGLKAIVKKKKPMLTKRHMRQRLEFAQKYREWTSADWRRVIFSDETKINRLGSDGRRWAWKHPSRQLSIDYIKPTLKFGGGSLMMWGCMTSFGVGHACRIEGNMDADLYCQIIEGELMQTIDLFELRVEDIIFQHDNDPKHASKLATDCLIKNKISLLSWPAQSPDMNPIEHIWGYLKKRLADYSNFPEGVNELWSRVEHEWEAISSAFCCNLIDSMPKRIHAVLKAKGGYTNY